MIRRYRKIFVIAFILIFFGSSIVNSVNIDDLKKLKCPQTKNNSLECNKTNELSRIVVYSSFKNGQTDIKTKTLRTVEKRDLIEKVNQVIDPKLSWVDNFKNELKILKDYDLVSDDLTFEDIFGSYNINNTCIKPKQKNNTDFAAYFAPIFIGGLGGGISFGFRRLPIVRRVAGNIFFSGVIVGGVVLCFDPVNFTTYFLLSAVVPPWLGFISGYVGIMLFGYDNIFPLPIPFTFYSNFIAFGVAGFTVWINPLNFLNN
jgi:hypothetical protein